MYDTVAIDGDILVYRAACVAQHTFYDIYADGELIETFEYSKQAKGYVEDQSEFFFEGDVLYEIRPRLEFFTEKEAREAFDMQMKAIKNKLKANHYKLYLTGKDNYRVNLATILKYKGNRDGTEKPYWFYNVREYAEKVWGAITVNGIECDDAISVVAYRGYRVDPKNPNTVCVSADKDLKNTPGLHFNPDSDDKPVLVTEGEAEYNFYKQVLKGDKQVDNIPGCPGLSKVTATKYGLRKSKGLGDKGAEGILAGAVNSFEMYQRCLEAYRDWYSEQDGWDGETETFQYKSWDGRDCEKTIEELVDEQCQLLWMKRIKDDMWVPPKFQG